MNVDSGYVEIGSVRVRCSICKSVTEIFDFSRLEITRLYLGAEDHFPQLHRQTNSRYNIHLLEQTSLGRPFIIAVSSEALVTTVATTLNWTRWTTTEDMD